MSVPTVTTARLTLRPLRENDIDAFHRILGEPDVLRYFPKSTPPTREQVGEVIAAQQRHWAERGYGWWAVIPRDSDRFMGWCGLQYLPDTDEVEVACLLGPEHWGRGYAIEGGAAALEYGFRELGVETIVAIVHPQNLRSRRAVETLGLAFTHEAVYFGMDARRYAIDRAAFIAREQARAGRFAPPEAVAAAFEDLNTPRLVLRRLRPEDADPMFRYRSHPVVSRFQGWAPGALSATAAFIEEQLRIVPDTPGTWLQLGMVARDTGELIGDCGIHFPPEKSHDVELGMTLAAQHQGRGYAMEALEAVLEYVFERLGKRRVYGSVDPRNTRSLKLLERAGMRQEAHFRESLWFKGAWADDVICAMLASEWRSARATRPDVQGGSD
jgi:RimJ/RimL family protein N-acetyltransferase